MKIKPTFILAGALMLASHLGAQAQTTAAPTEMTEAEVRKVDADNKKVTLRHGEIKNLSMPGMTMVFAVKDPDMLKQLKVGDKIKFTADKVGGTFTVMSIEPRP